MRLRYRKVAWLFLNDILDVSGFGSRMGKRMHSEEFKIIEA